MEDNKPRNCRTIARSTGEKCRNTCKVHPCRTHGGSIKRVKRAKQRRAALSRIASMVPDSAPDTDPIDHLLDAIHRAARATFTLGLAVVELEHADQTLVQGRHGPAPHPWVVEYRHAVSEQARLAKLALDAGVEERRVKAAEAEVLLLFNAVMAALESPELALDATRRTAARQIVARKLREMEVG